MLILSPVTRFPNRIQLKARIILLLISQIPDFLVFTSNPAFDMISYELNSLFFLSHFWINSFYFPRITFPTSGALLSKQAPQEIQGTILGISSGARALMRIIGPILGTYLYAVDVALPYQIAAILLALGFLLIFVLLRIINKNSITDKSKEYKAVV